ncbi:MAG: hypothetical protein JW725_05095 [Candidatus Babeliaceae bacterium]|nr:hypothetical protein [Candidatus Babeliaceae bacterium]
MKDIQENYSYVKFKKHSPLDTLKEYANDFNQIDNEAKFINKLVGILALFKDPHINLTYEDNKGRRSSIKTLSKHPARNYDHELLSRKYLSNGIIFENKVGMIGMIKDVVYINIFTWWGLKKREVNRLIKQFKKIVSKKNSKKIIIDVRSNNGGSDLLSGKFLSLFIPKNKKLYISKYLHRLSKRNPNKTGRIWKRYQDSDAQPISASLAVLIGQNCMSSNEYLVMGFDALRDYLKKNNYSNAINLVGDRTFGSSGNPKEFSYLSGRLKIGIPSWICYTSKGELLEGKGIKPNIRINSNETIFRGHDKVLEKAITILSK